MTGAFPRSFPLRRFDRLIIPATESKIDTRKTNNERFFAQSGYEDRRRRRWQKEGKKNGAGAQGAVLLRWLTFPLFVGPILLLLIFFLSITEKGEGQFRSFVRVAKGKKKDPYATNRIRYESKHKKEGSRIQESISSISISFSPSIGSRGKWEAAEGRWVCNEPTAIQSTSLVTPPHTKGTFLYLRFNSLPPTTTRTTFLIDFGDPAERVILSRSCRKNTVG